LEARCHAAGKEKKRHQLFRRRLLWEMQQLPPFVHILLLLVFDLPLLWF
jgi:hypothetical protein